MSTKFIDNFYSGKWDSIVDSLMIRDGQRIAYGEDFYKNVDGRFDEIIKLWEEAGYNEVDTVEWINYYPEKDFPKLVVEDFEKFIGFKCARAWISRLRPGKYAPIHKDIDDEMEKYLEQGELVRFSVFISQPYVGAVVVIGDDCFHCVPSGNTYEWTNFMDWHAAGNCGLHDQFMFHFLGVKTNG